MSEKSTRNNLNYAVEFTAARNRPVLTSNAAWLLQNPQERYNPSESVPKKEIPNTISLRIRHSRGSAFVPE